MTHQFTDSQQSHLKIKSFLTKLEGDLISEAQVRKELHITRKNSIVPEAPKVEQKAILNVDGKKVEIPILIGTDGVQMLDIQALYGQGGVFCYDPGYTITGSCISAIGNATKEGGLFYRGYAIEDLVEQSSYVEVCFILLYGNKPTPE